MKPRLSLSSCWCSHRHNDGYVMLKEMADLGFSHAELSHGVRISLIPGIQKAVEEGIIQISSTHNFCPLPPGVLQAAPNLFEPSSSDHREREQWLRYTKRSIEMARQLGAKILVCHLGSAKFLWGNPEKKLDHYLEQHPDGVKDDKVYAELLQKCVKRLRSKMGPHLERTKESIRQVFDFATENGIRLGLENREGFNELPFDADYLEFIESFPPTAPIGYWHDTGHAEIKQSMGLLEQQAHLEKMAARLIGFHLHDVDAKNSDHQTVGSGSVDFKMISRFWRPEHTLVLELSPRLSVEDVLLSKERIEALLR